MIELLRKAKELIVARSFACKKIRVRIEDVKSTVDKIFRYLILFNSLDEYADRVLDRDFSEVLILKEFACFIMPSSVRVNPSDRMTKDLIIRTFTDNIDISSMSYADFLDAQLTWRNFFKKDCSNDMETLASIRVPKSFDSIINDIAIFKGTRTDTIETEDAEKEIGIPVFVTKARIGSFYPILVDKCVSCMFRDDYFNIDALIAIEDFLSPVTFN